MHYPEWLYMLDSRWKAKVKTPKGIIEVDSEKGNDRMQPDMGNYYQTG